MAEPSGKEVHHFITNALRSMQVVASGRVDKENMGEYAVNHLLVILRQAKQRVQVWYGLIVFWGGVGFKISTFRHFSSNFI